VVWEQLGAETPVVVQGQSSRWGSGAKPPKDGEVFAFKTLIFSTFSGSFHQINKHQPHFCVSVYLMNNEQHVHLSIRTRPYYICTRPAGHEKPCMLSPGPHRF